MIPESGTSERETWSYGEAIQAGRRLGCRPSEAIDDWWISWSPRNDNQNAEGEWAEWVELARAILERDKQINDKEIRS